MAGGGTDTGRVPVREIDELRNGGGVCSVSFSSVWWGYG